MTMITVTITMVDGTEDGEWHVLKYNKFPHIKLHVSIYSSMSLISIPPECMLVQLYILLCCV